MTKFEDDLSYGTVGEKIFAGFIKRQASTNHLLDVTKDKFFQDHDIDFIVEKTNGEIIKYEVKTDSKTHETKNIIWEVKSSEYTEGCMEKCEADWIFYYIPGYEMALLYSMKKMRQYLSNREFTLVKMGDSAKGYLIPLQDLLFEGVGMTIKKDKLME